MRQTPRILLRPGLSILIVACALNCGPKSVKLESSAEVVDARSQPSLGYLEHRGEMYDLRDWGSFMPERGRRSETVADFMPLPTIADRGVLTGLLDGTFHTVKKTSTLIDIELPLFMIGFEDTEEEQCVELSDLEGLITTGVRPILPE